MREGLLFTGLMAAVVATTAVVNAVAPDLIGTQHVKDTPAVVGPPATVPASPPASSAVPVPPASVDVMPPSVTSIPTPVKPASPRSSSAPSEPEPTPVTQVPGEGEPPPPGEPCPIDLVLDPLLGVCVVI